MGKEHDSFWNYVFSLTFASLILTHLLIPWEQSIQPLRFLVYHWSYVGFIQELILYFIYYLKYIQITIYICTYLKKNFCFPWSAHVHIFRNFLKDIQRLTKYAHRVYYLVVLHSVVSVTPPLEFKLFLDSATSQIQKLNLYFL